ncbi:OPT family oligopeptide transporter [Clostridium minihomine]|uniref:OPT family oligopeptide transporter n=1 Tax=Clostridium minihomine TaxID=2045012 RepID=UPI001A918ECA|nr:oligopeptide transporter, OPT family [Clostridium minihomine]
MDDKNFKPYIPADKVMPEFTVYSVGLGILLVILFGAANAYLGLRVGMTVSAAIPAAVISMGIIRVVLKRDSILENNMVQTIGSAGEALAAGAIFTMPALFMWAKEGLSDMPSLTEISLIALCGGILGVLFMVPLRTALIVKEHGTLAYPEGQACAQVLMAGEEGGNKASTVFIGLGVAAGYKFITDGMKLFPSEIDWAIPAYRGAGIGADVLPALAGVGYICGAKVSSYLLAGGATAWFVIMPLMALFGSDLVIFPASVSVAELWATGGTWGLWSNFVRYIGAGAVAAGGIITLIKTLPLIVRTFRDAISGFGQNTKGTLRTEQDIPMKYLLGGIVVIALVMWLVPAIPVNLLGALIIIVFGFFFATVSSRMVGLIGSSNNPVSGMSIATLLIATMILKATGNGGIGGMIAAITIGSVICITAAMAGDTSQDLKTGYLVGATPIKQQVGQLIGAVVSALTIGGVLYLLNMAWGYGSAELPAPQATLMKMVVEGVMGDNLPWSLVFTGVCIAIVIEILQIPVLPFAIGLYLPIHLSVPIMAGGLIRLYLEKRKASSEKAREDMVQSGVLYSSGLIAGEGLIGVLLAVFAAVGANLALPENLRFGNFGGLIAFILLLLTMLKFTVWNKKLNK